MLPAGQIVHYIGDGSRKWDCVVAMVLYSVDDTCDIWMFQQMQPYAGIPLDEDRATNTFHVMHVRGDFEMDEQPQE